MHANAFGRLKIEMRLRRFGWIHMNELHEPARFVSTDRQERQIDWAKSLPNVAEEASVCGVACKKDAGTRGAEQESTPESTISIQRTSGGEMLCWRQCDWQR